MDQCCSCYMKVSRYQGTQYNMFGMATKYAWHHAFSSSSHKLNHTFQEAESVCPKTCSNQKQQGDLSVHFKSKCTCPVVVDCKIMNTLWIVILVINYFSGMNLFSYYVTLCQDY